MTLEREGMGEEWGEREQVVGMGGTLSFWDPVG